MTSPARAVILPLLFLLASGALHEACASSYAAESNPELAKVQQREVQHEARSNAARENHQTRDRRFRELLLKAVQRAEKDEAARNAKRKKGVR